MDLDLSLLEQAIFTDDRVSRVLKLHCMTEVFLNRALSKLMKVEQRKLDDLGLFYSKKLKILIAAGIVDSHEATWLWKLNDMRKRCAHELSYQPTVEEAKDLFESLPHKIKIPAAMDEFDGYIASTAAFMCGYLGGLSS